MRILSLTTILLIFSVTFPMYALGYTVGQIFGLIYDGYKNGHKSMQGFINKLLQKIKKSK